MFANLMVSHSSALLVSHVCFDFSLSPWNDPFLNERPWSSFSVGLPLTLCTFITDLSEQENKPCASAGTAGNHGGHDLSG